jgi:stringent starvation protein B
MHEWMVDNDLTPHIVVDAGREGVRVPAGHVKDGKIVLNVSPTATRALTLGNDLVTFEARFNGVAQQLSVPVAAVLGVYARETGHAVQRRGRDANAFAGRRFADADARRRTRRRQADAAEAQSREVIREPLIAARAVPRRSGRRGSG